MNLSAIKLKIVSFFKKINVVYLIILIVLVIIFEVVWAYKTLNGLGSSAVKLSGNVQTPVKTPLNVISLNSAKNNYKIGEKIPITVDITSNKNIAGADLIIKYDPNLLTVMTNSDKTPVSVGTLFTDYPVNTVDEKIGMITISGITNKTTGLVPKGVFGTITFQGKAVGSPKVFLEFMKGLTNDTNLIENQSAQDVLEEVKNLDLRITP